MSKTLIDENSVVLVTFTPGRAAGFATAVRAFSVTTPGRATDLDCAILTRPEALQVAFAILKDEMQDRGLPETLVNTLEAVLGRK